MRMHHRRRFLVESASLAVGLALDPVLLADTAKAPRLLTILLFGGALPEVRKDMEKRARVKFLTAGVVKGKKGDAPDNIEGLEQLKNADLFIGSIQKRVFPSKEQLGHFHAFHAAGKPVAGYRGCSHVFQNWLAVDREVF